MGQHKLHHALAEAEEENTTLRWKHKKKTLTTLP